VSDDPPPCADVLAGAGDEVSLAELALFEELAAAEPSPAPPDALELAVVEPVALVEIELALVRVVVSALA
jgi:hypothetical protein